MSGKKQGLKPDTVLKNYWEDNERFADLFNAVLFAGEQVISPEEYLSKMRKTDRFAPVINLVLHYGEKPWDGGKVVA